MIINHLQRFSPSKYRAKSRKSFSQKNVDNRLVKIKLVEMKNWIPRSERWTSAEREAKKLANMNEKSLQRMFWCELDTMRQQIEKEISEKKLARIRLLE